MFAIALQTESVKHMVRSDGALHYYSCSYALWDSYIPK